MLKTHQWHNWQLLYSVVSLTGHLPEEYLTHRKLLVPTHHSAMSWVLMEATIQKVQNVLPQFVVEFVVLYCDYGMEYNDGEVDSRQIQLWTSHMHALMHMADQLRNCGPMCCWWEWITETYGGLLKMR